MKLTALFSIAFVIVASSNAGELPKILKVYKQVMDSKFYGRELYTIFLDPYDDSFIFPAFVVFF